MISLLKKLFGSTAPRQEGKPFMEHPDGTFDNAIAAMEDAIHRLRSLPEWTRWITFCAQGQGARPEAYAMAEVRMRGGTLEILSEKPLESPGAFDLSPVTGPSEQDHAPGGGHVYALGDMTPLETARMLDSIFRRHFQIRPFPDEEDDYAVGAEW
ncbi:hypothetical protein [Roseimicrobium sp. ORNL1]|uniref:hypothetical protein n=1 Tax=Roseimicrobium sp. ORNL1 TaxID=2711231 RepID=UPI0013E14414|nr:hypothetical protein [Roseimicrobium sp. ORNL1]QIF01726.1 hypothetical protein G5S37_09380 [Roseimicrobium sp. ORNL1]